MTAPAPRADTDLPVVRLRSPAELAAGLPLLCGFVPTESLVVVTLRGSRSRVGLTMRVDLPPPAHTEPVVGDVVRRVLASGAHAALVVVCTDEPDRGGLPRGRLVRRLRRGLTGVGLGADEALLVGDGRWWSYVCRDRTCCPAEGTPVPTSAASSGLALVEAHAALDGRAVLPSRAALETGLAAPEPTPAWAAALAGAQAGRQTQAGVVGRAAAGRRALAAWRRAVAAGPAHRPGDAEAAALVASLDDVVVCEEVLSTVADDDQGLLALLLDLARRTPPPHDAQVCALLGWTAHARGDGATANVALDRALASRPGLPLAQLARQVLDGQVPPSQLRRLLADTRRVRHATHPWTAP